MTAELESSMLTRAIEEAEREYDRELDLAYWDSLDFTTQQEYTTHNRTTF